MFSPSFTVGKCLWNCKHSCRAEKWFPPTLLHSGAFFSVQKTIKPAGCWKLLFKKGKATFLTVDQTVYLKRRKCLCCLRSSAREWRCYFTRHPAVLIVNRKQKSQPTYRGFKLHDGIDSPPSFSGQKSYFVLVSSFAEQTSTLFSGLLENVLFLLSPSVSEEVM